MKIRLIDIRNQIVITELDYQPEMHSRIVLSNSFFYFFYESVVDYTRIVATVVDIIVYYADQITDVYGYVQDYSSDAQVEWAPSDNKIKASEILGYENHGCIQELEQRSIKTGATLCV